MHKIYEELIRQMEQDSRRAEEWQRLIVQSGMPADKLWEPLVDIYETRDALKVKVELAGVRPEDIQLELAADGGALTVRGWDPCPAPPIPRTGRHRPAQ